MGKPNYSKPFALLTALFFMWGFITALNDILIPHLKGLFQFSNTQAQIVNLAFFGAYFVFALPASWLIKKTNHQKSIVIALIIIGLGALLFYPAAEYVSFSLFLTALFIIASGITVLQVAANPFVTILGSPEKAASRLNLAQAFNSLGTIIGPLLGTVLLLNNREATTIEKAQAVEGPYIGLGVGLFLIAILFALVKLPTIKEEEETSATKKSLKDFPHLIFGIIAIFCYVGAEVAIGSNIVFFLELEEIAGFNEKEAGFYVSLYWASAMLGRFIGAALQTKYKPSMILAFATMTAMILVGFGMFSTGNLAMYSVLAIGLFNSVMFPTIFSLSVQGLGSYTNKASGYLIMAIVGGALIPPIMGYLSTDPATGETSRLQMSFVVPLACYVYIIFYALKWYKPKSQLS